MRLLDVGLHLWTTFHLVHRTSHKTSLNGGNTMPMPRHSVQHSRSTATDHYIMVNGTMRSCLSLYTAPELWTCMPLLDSGPVNILYDLPT